MKPLSFKSHLSFLIIMALLALFTFTVGDTYLPGVPWSGVTIGVNIILVFSSAMFIFSYFTSVNTNILKDNTNKARLLRIGVDVLVGFLIIGFHATIMTAVFAGLARAIAVCLGGYQEKPKPE